MNTRARVTAAPALLAAGAVVSLPGFLKVAAASQASPAAAEVAAWSELGLPELELHFTSTEATGMPESVEAGRYLVTIHGEPTPGEGAFGTLFLQIPKA
jgi:hypothetical protein